jgi:flagellar biosynthesis chaperone FliJ
LKLFDWIDESKSKDNLGFIAQEVEEVIPEIVEDITNIDGEEHKVVNYQAVVPVLVEAIKEQQNLINKLEARLNELEKSMEKK